MKRIFGVMLVSAAFAAAQKIETQKANRAQITRLETAMNHLSVIELGEEVTQVAVGSSAYKVEWRDNKVFVQPLEANARTNLFIWTKGGRLNYELAPASVDTMHFAIDEEPAEAARVAEPVVPEQAGLPSAMLLEATPVGRVGTPARSAKSVEVAVTDLYRRDGKLYVRYTLRNHGAEPYRVAAPSVYRLVAARSTQSLVPVHDAQLVGERLRSDAELPVPLVYSETKAAEIEPGSTAVGLVAFDEPQAAADSKPVVKLEFPRRNADAVVAYLVL